MHHYLTKFQKALKIKRVFFVLNDPLNTETKIFHLMCYLPALMSREVARCIQCCDSIVTLIIYLSVQ